MGPCGNYEGVAGELAAIASQQRAARAEGRPGFDVVIDILGAPAWAALPPHGCELAATPASARPIGGAALAGYRALIAGLLALAAREGVQLPWWSPWNEPNDPRFLAPQRAACGPDAEPLAPAVYSQLAEAMAAHRLSIGQFLDGLPANVLCLGNTWAVHAYVARGRRAIEPDPVRALERALDARGGCASGARIWVTESGAGAPSPGRAREGGGGEELGACEALAAQTGKWHSDPRVEAIFQYEFRDDPAFPVGVASADLSRLRSTYRVWLALSRAPEGASPVSTPTAICVP